MASLDTIYYATCPPVAWSLAACARFSPLFVLTDDSSHPGAAGADTADAADLQAVSETLRGNHDAFRGIVDRHGSLVLRLSISFLRNREEAEEACQEIFFKAFRSLRSFDLEKAFLPWLYALAVNYLRTRYRRNKRQQNRVANFKREGPSEASTIDPSSLVEEAETREQLVRAVEALPRGIREVVSMYYLGEMSVSRVAKALGIGVENVKSKLNRGRKVLRRYFDRKHPRAQQGSILR